MGFGMMYWVQDEKCFSDFAASIAPRGVTIWRTNVAFESIFLLANVMLKSIEEMMSIPGDMLREKLFLTNQFTCKQAD